MCTPIQHQSNTNSQTPTTTTQVADRRQGVTYTLSDAGASCTPSARGVHEFGWRDAMDVAVRWRQLSEPHDQVVWVDLLTRKEFESGFGSHTPIFSGQTKCVRYYMNFERAMELRKRCLLEQGCAYDAKSCPGIVEYVPARYGFCSMMGCRCLLMVCCHFFQNNGRHSALINHSGH